MLHISNRILISLLLLALTQIANSTSVHPNGIDVRPTFPTTTDFIAAYIYGFYASPGYSLLSAPTLDTSGNVIEIDVLISSPAIVGPPILDPFSYVVDIGYLDIGSYSVTSNFYVDGILDNTISNDFSVSAVPVPAAFYLFISGVMSIFALAKRKHLTISTS